MKRKLVKRRRSSTASRAEKAYRRAVDAGTELRRLAGSVIEALEFYDSDNGHTALILAGVTAELRRIEDEYQDVLFTEDGRARRTAEIIAAARPVPAVQKWPAVRSIVEINDEASENFPSSQLASGYRIHVCQWGNEPGWVVWLNTEAGDFDGLCVGTGPTRDAAVADAVKVLEQAVEKLQGPR